MDTGILGFMIYRHTDGRIILVHISMLQKSKLSLKLIKNMDQITSAVLNSVAVLAVAYMERYCSITSS